jgi:hypothetical protein
MGGRDTGYAPRHQREPPPWDSVGTNATTEGDTMRRRLIIAISAATLAISLSAAPALAHPNEAAGKGVGPPPHANVWNTAGLGHDGMECGAANPNTPLVPLGLSCPAAS